ncbi:MAG: hypothetical protein ATN32_05285 [Candidatus Epulonipiscium fishelsonii]|nr:MAG: hypothetical protein ATN32_05285 [Epulopiscium sp. AS2M-Bin002]
MKKLVLGMMAIVMGATPVMGAQLYSSAPSMQQKTYILQVSGGHSVFIENSNFTTTLINAGKSADSKFIIDYIEGLGHSRIDTVIGTQNLSDSGLDEVVEEFKVGRILMANGYRPELFEDLHEVADDKGIKIQVFDLDEVIDHVNVLLAQQPLVTYPYENDMSVSLPVPTPGPWYDYSQVGGGYVMSPGTFPTYPNDDDMFVWGPAPGYDYENDMSVGVPVPDPGLWYDNSQVGGGYIMSPGTFPTYPNDDDMSVWGPGPGYYYDNDMSVGVPVPDPGPWYDNSQVGGGYIMSPGSVTSLIENDMSVSLPVPTP